LLIFDDDDSTTLGMLTTYMGGHNTGQRLDNYLARIRIYLYHRRTNKLVSRIDAHFVIKQWGILVYIVLCIYLPKVPCTLKSELESVIFDICMIG